MFDEEFEGLFIPKEIFQDYHLTAQEKIILTQIDILAKQRGGCAVTNKYLANLCICSQRCISKAIAKFIDLKYIRWESFDGRHRVLKSNLKFS